MSDAIEAGLTALSAEELRALVRDYERRQDMVGSANLDRLEAEIDKLRKAIEIAELMFRRFKGKQITGAEAAGMMRASIETTLSGRAQRFTG